MKLVSTTGNRIIVTVSEEEASALRLSSNFRVVGFSRVGNTVTLRGPSEVVEGRQSRKDRRTFTFHKHRNSEGGTFTLNFTHRGSNLKPFKVHNYPTEIDELQVSFNLTAFLLSATESAPSHVVSQYISGDDNGTPLDEKSIRQAIRLVNKAVQEEKIYIFLEDKLGKMQLVAQMSVEVR